MMGAAWHYCLTAAAHQLQVFLATTLHSHACPKHQAICAMMCLALPALAACIC